jgi:hypothetical protein
MDISLAGGDYGRFGNRLTRGLRSRSPGSRAAVLDEAALFRRDGDFFRLENLEINSGRHTHRRAIAEVLDGLLKLKIEKLHFPNWYQGSRGEPNRLADAVSNRTFPKPGIVSEEL